VARSEKCKGCQHDRPSSTDYCYMFENKPWNLPCGQHDKYKDLRQRSGRLMRQHPIMLQMLTMQSILMERKLKNNEQSQR
jgi:hypothetical protein